MKKYKSNEEFFAAFKILVQRIDQKSPAAAQELKNGFSCLNGLTDGWALLMESIDKTLTQYRANLEKNDSNELAGMISAIKKVVYRR